MYISTQIHTCNTAHTHRYFVQQLTSLRHANGAPVAHIYGAHNLLMCTNKTTTHSTIATTNTPTNTPPNTPPNTPLPPAAAAALGLYAATGQGPTVAFNLTTPENQWVGYTEIQRITSLHDIVLRTGCCCNPGACAAAVGLTEGEMYGNYTRGHVCWDAHDVMDGKPTGVVRYAVRGWEYV